MEAAMGTGQASPGYDGLTKAVEAPADDRLGRQLEEERSMALDAARFHARELIRALRVADAAESGMDGLRRQPEESPNNAERMSALLIEASQEQVGAQPTAAPGPRFLEDYDADLRAQRHGEETRWASHDEGAAELLARLAIAGFEIRRKERPAPEFGPGGGA